MMLEATEPTFDFEFVRSRFPSLQQRVGEYPAAFFDGPGGTQVPLDVIEAMAAYLASDNANVGGPFSTSRHTDEIVDSARQSMADFYHAAEPSEVVFGANMTTLTLSLSRSIARTWEKGDSIVLSRLDHDANVSPWLLAAMDRGVEVRWLDFDPGDCVLDLDSLGSLLDERTRLLAVGMASNAVGTVNDVAEAVRIAHGAGAWVFVDAVHAAPHRSIDVRALDCDFLVSSPYKYFGPHSGVLYGKLEHLEGLEAYKVRPAPSESPGKWETGTQSFESLAGIHAAIDYLVELSPLQRGRRERLVDAMERIERYEASLSERFLVGAATVPGLKVTGITDAARLSERTPTFAVSLEGWTPESLAVRLGEQGFFVWHGHYYAVEVMRRLGVLDSGGLVRIGFVHYNTVQEIDRLLDTLGRLAREAR